MRDHHTLESGIVQDVLHCLSKNPFPESYLGGGIGIQLLLRDVEYFRETGDVDLTTSKNLTASSFAEDLTKSLEELLRRSYTIEYSKQRYTYDAKLKRDDNELLIQIPRRSKQNSEKRNNIILRELKNAKPLPYGPGYLHVISPEDIIAHKLIRSITFVDEYNINNVYFNDLTDLKKQIARIKEENSNFYLLEPKDAQKVIATVRLYSDIFDIVALLKNKKEFNETYMLDALTESEKASGSEKLDRQIEFYKSLKEQSLD